MKNTFQYSLGSEELANQPSETRPFVFLEKKKKLAGFQDTHKYKHPLTCLGYVFQTGTGFIRISVGFHQTSMTCMHILPSSQENLLFIYDHLGSLESKKKKRLDRGFLYIHLLAATSLVIP